MASATRLSFITSVRHENPMEGEINFILNEEPVSFSANFAREHVPYACTMVFYIMKGAVFVYQHALSLGAQTIYGIGDRLLYLVDHCGKQSIYDSDFNYFPDVDRHARGIV